MIGEVCRYIKLCIRTGMANSLPKVFDRQRGERAAIFCADGRSMYKAV